MSSIYPDSYDMLNLSGILPYDVSAIVNEKPSPYLTANGRKPLIVLSPDDKFTPTQKPPKPKKPIDWKAVGLGTILTYVAGVILSKGKLNPLKGLQAIGKTLLKIVKLPLKLFKK